MQSVYRKLHALCQTVRLASQEAASRICGAHCSLTPLKTKEIATEHHHTGTARRLRLEGLVMHHLWT